MKLRHIIPLSLSYVFLFNSLSYPETSQYFDSDGNSLSSGSRTRETSLSYGVQGSYIPEGVELQKDIRYEFFPVFGKTFSDIVRSAEENSPADLKNKRRLPSRAVWVLGWSYKIAHSYGIDEEDKTVHVAVEIYDINITCDFTITLPALIDDSALNPAEKNLWKNYYLRLIEYESDHARIIRDKEAQEELRKKFGELSYVIFEYSADIDIQKTVETFIRKETEKIGSAWAKNLKKRIGEYDLTTEFGLALQKRGSFFRQKEK